MTAGSISAPAIIPLRPAQYGETHKFTIDTNTFIEITSETKSVDIYYTLDGSKPDPLTPIAVRRSTIQYKKPFCIPKAEINKGQVTIKAIAVSKFVFTDDRQRITRSTFFFRFRDGVRESVVVTKTFSVNISVTSHSPTEENENRYVYELQQERKVKLKKILSVFS